MLELEWPQRLCEQVGNDGTCKRWLPGEEVKRWEEDDVRIPAMTFLSLLPGHHKGATASLFAS